MGYDSEQKSGGAAIVIIVIVAMLLLGALLVVGVGAFFFVRVSSMEQRAMVQQERAAMKAMESRAAQEAIQQAIARGNRKSDQAALPETTTLAPLSTAALTIILQQDGRLIIDDTEFTDEALQDRLRDSPPKSVTIQADPRCPASHVVELLTLCRQAGVQQLDIKGP